MAPGPRRGQDSRGEPPSRATGALAGQLGTRVRHFPGGHIGPITHPGAFGAPVRKVFLAR
ncbi:hypothetical protein ACIP98_13795 [Streptomyces sp. NPDC088354]|uniref:hypothetical protein n=1 Tax=Streptomyces sp. NPDC088354 TaxID=3365856 RepID=UPI00382B7A1F